MSETKVPLFVCGKDNRPMVKVPAGEFLYGEDQEKTETKEFFIDPLSRHQRGLQEIRRCNRPY